MPELSVTFRLDSEPAQVGRARELIHKVLPDWGLVGCEDVFQLIVSELVTNALPHCDRQIEVTVAYNGEDVRVEVWDSGDEMPVRQAPRDDEESGRGLALIDALVKMHGGWWGIARHASRGGKAVYVTMPSPWSRSGGGQDYLHLRAKFGMFSPGSSEAQARLLTGLRPSPPSHVRCG
jgi:signal transduction histidine kinase